MPSKPVSCLKHIVLSSSCTMNVSHTFICCSIYAWFIRIIVCFGGFLLDCCVQVRIRLHFQYKSVRINFHFNVEDLWKYWSTLLIFTQSFEGNCIKTSTEWWKALKHWICHIYFIVFLHLNHFIKHIFKNLKFINENNIWWVFSRQQCLWTHILIIAI